MTFCVSESVSSCFPWMLCYFLCMCLCTEREETCTTACCLMMKSTRTSRWSTLCRKLSTAARKKLSALPPLSTEMSVSLHTHEQVHVISWRVQVMPHLIMLTDCVLIQGRKSVRYGDFQFCEQAKSVIVVSVWVLIWHRVMSCWLIPCRTFHLGF